MSAIPRARALHRRRQANLPARGDESENVLGPGALVEVHGQEPAGLIFEKWVDTHDMATLQVRKHGRIGDQLKGLIGTFAALDPRKLAQALTNLFVHAGAYPGLPVFLLVNRVG